MLSIQEKQKRHLRKISRRRITATDHIRQMRGTRTKQAARTKN